MCCQVIVCKLLKINVGSPLDNVLAIGVHFAAEMSEPIGLYRFPSVIRGSPLRTGERAEKHSSELRDRRQRTIYDGQRITSLKQAEALTAQAGSRACWRIHTANHSRAQSTDVLLIALVSDAGSADGAKHMSRKRYRGITPEHSVTYEQISERYAQYNAYRQSLNRSKKTYQSALSGVSHSLVLPPNRQSNLEQAENGRPDNRSSLPSAKHNKAESCVS